MLTEWKRAQAGVTGLLSGSGTDMLRVVVLLRPVPAEPPEGLAGLVAPVYGDGGLVRDWRLSPAEPAGVVSDDVSARYSAWRRQFMTERFIGERALVNSFLDWAEVRCDVSALQPLRLRSAHLDVGDTLRARWQLQQVQRKVRDSQDVGFGVLIPPASHSPARGLIPTTALRPLLAIDDTALFVEPTGLILRAVGGGVEALSVRGWHVTERGVVADTPDGTVELARSPAAGLLVRLGRRAPAVAVAPVRLRRLLAPMLMFLQDAADLAVRCDTGLHTYSTWR